MPLPITIKLDIFEWLSISGKGQALNASNAVPAATIQNFNIDPPVGYDYIVVHALQWDGITPGTVTFEMHGGQNSLIAGFAVQQFIQDELYITDRGRPLNVIINNGSAAPIVYNIDYIAVPARVWESEVLPMFTTQILGQR